MSDTIVQNYTEDPNKGSPQQSTKKIPMVELFGPTIQGEGAVIGYQTHFLRLGGCDFKCERCDSLHAVLPEMVKANSQYMTVEEMTEHVERYFLKHPCEWLTLSGGNPAIWDLYHLVVRLRNHGIKIAVETQGSIWAPWLHHCTKVTVSPKGPGMGEKFILEQFQVFIDNLAPYENGNYRHPGFSIKVVIFDQRDIEFAVELMDLWPQIRPVMFFSVGNVTPPAPALRSAEPETHEEFVKQTLDSYRMVAEEVMNDPRCSSVRILPQLHTLLWGNKQGH